jgi:transcription initiation factor TFIID subunit TAF12
MFDGLMRMQRRVQHIHLLFKNCQVSAVRTILQMQNRVGMMLNLFNYAGIFDVEDAQYSRLETASKEESLWVGSKT